MGLIEIVFAGEYDRKLLQGCESKQSFTVKDRRQFTVEGERKASAEDAEWAAPPSETGSRIAVPPSASPAQGTGEVEFGSFLVSLAAQGGAMLAAEGAERDLDGARQIIGILEMLKSRTEGRRTPEEDRIFDGLLYQLRMAYVEVSRGVPR